MEGKRDEVHRWGISDDAPIGRVTDMECDYAEVQVADRVLSWEQHQLVEHDRGK